MKRRDAVKLINGLFLGMPFTKSEIKSGTRIMQQDEVVKFASDNQIRFIAEDLGQDEHARDFGKVYKAIPRVVLIPDSTEKLGKVLRFVHSEKIPIVPRGARHSVTGQSLVTKQGVCLDLRNINQIGDIATDPGGQAVVTCSPGTTLGQLNEYVMQSNYMVPAQPFFPDLTVGGVLAAGGVGSASHLYGLLISNISELRVLTGEGSMITCSADVNTEIFNAVLGTFGHFGIITKAKLKLIRAKKLYRVHRLVYEHQADWFTDYQLLRSSGISNLQGIIIRSPKDQQSWNYLLEVSLDADETGELNQKEELLSKLKFINRLPSSDLTPLLFLNRYQSRFHQMRTNGKYEQHHPFLEFIIAADQAPGLINKALQVLPPGYEDGFRLIYINKRNIPPFFMVPDAKEICMFAVLPTGINKEVLTECLEAANQLHRHAMSLGAKRYLSGWLDMISDEELKQHFEDKAGTMIAMKKKLDPSNILRSAFSEKFCSWMKS